MQLKIVFLLGIIFAVLPKLEALETSPYRGVQECDSQVLLLQLKPDAGELKLRSFLKNEFGFHGENCIAIFPNHSSSELNRIYKLIGFLKVDGIRLISKLLDSDLVNYVEYAPVLRTFLTPDDLDIRQWYLKRIQAEQAWGLNTGNAEIRLAIVDDAVDVLHEDLNQVIYKNLSEIPGNGIDDDANGYVDDVNGWHAYYKHGNPMPPYLNRSQFSHGTHCAGIAAAHTDNGKGIASIAYNIRIIPVACTDTLKPGFINAGYEGIVYAADAGANVISLSWGGSYYSKTGQTVIDYALGKGAVVCAAAGNSNTSLRMYPAAYNGVIAVAATGSSDQKASFSNYGNWIDVSAPGTGIWSTVTGFSGLYAHMSGTSMACPLTAGLCALMLSRNQKLTAAELESCLKNSADGIDVLNPAYAGMLGKGRINAFKALQCIKPLFADFAAGKTLICPGDSIRFQNKSSSGATLYSWRIPGAKPTYSSEKDPWFVFDSTGHYDVQLLVSDGINSDSFKISQYVEVRPVIARMDKQVHKIKKGETVFLSVTLVGQAPWNISIGDGVSVRHYSAVASNPFYFDVNPTEDSKYFVSSVSDSRCSGLGFDTTTVLVDTSVTSPGNGLGCGNFDLFSKTYDFDADEIPHFVYSLKDGNLAVVGLSNKGVIGGDDIFLSKINLSGEIIWTRYYGTAAHESGAPLGVSEDDSFNLYLFGSSLASGAPKGFLIKTDSSGKVLFTKRGVSGNVGDHVRAALLMNNGNMVYAGTSAITNDQAAGVRIETKQGGELFRRSFNSSGQTEHFTDVKQIRNHVYLLGATSVGSGSYGTMLCKMDLNGNLSWQKYLDHSIWDAGFFAEKTDRSSLILGYLLSNLGTSNFGGMDLGISHCDSNGNVVWSKIIGESGKEHLSGIVRLNGDYYISGVTGSFDNGNSKMFLIKMDINGNVKWSKIYGATGEAIDKGQFGKMLSVGNDGSFFLLGQKKNTDNDIVLYKIDQCGNSACHWKDVVFKSKYDNPLVSASNLSNPGLINMALINTSGIASGSVSVNEICTPVKQKPECNLLADFNYKYRCINDSVLFFDVSRDSGGTGISAYKWVFHDSTFITRVSQAAFRYKVYGSYPVSLIVYSDTPGLCRDTVTKILTIDKRSFSTLKLSRDSICLNDTLRPGIDNICGFSPYKVEWYPGIYFDNPNSLIPVFRPLVSTWLRYRLTDGNNTVSSDSVFVTVNAKCCAYQAQVQLSDTQLCAGESLDFGLQEIQPASQIKWYLEYEGTLTDSFSGGRIIGYALNKPGSYTFRVSVKGACRSAQAEAFVYVNPLPFVDAGKDTVLCGPYLYRIGSESISRHTYEWFPQTGLDNPSASDPKADVRQNITYRLKVTSLESACHSADSVTVSVADEMENLYKDTGVCDGASVLIGAGNRQIDVQYRWEDGSDSHLRRVNKPGTYVLIRNNLCESRMDTIQVRAKACFCDYLIPNAFSPDGNGLNEYFPMENLETITAIQIFNRWGELIYNNQNAVSGWDGTYKGSPVQQGVYLYLISYKNCYGIQRYLTGTFTLLR